MAADKAVAKAAASPPAEPPMEFVVLGNALCSRVMRLRKDRLYSIKALLEREEYLDYLVLKWAQNGIDVLVCWQVIDDGKGPDVRILDR